MLAHLSVGAAASMAAGAGLLGAVIVGAAVFGVVRTMAHREERRRLTFSVHERLLQARSFEHDTLVALQDSLADYLVAANRSLLARDKLLLRRDEWSTTPLDPDLVDELYQADIRSGVLLGRIEDDELRATADALRAQCARIAAGDRDDALAAAADIVGQWATVNQRLGLLIRRTGPLHPAA